jgi:hypothetical protein
VLTNSSGNSIPCIAPQMGIIPETHQSNSLIKSSRGLLGPIFTPSAGSAKVSEKFEYA